MIRLPLVRCLAAAVCLVLATSVVRAAGPYLHGFDPIPLLAPPSVLHTPEDTADRDSAFQIYRGRTPADVARGKAEKKVTIFAFTPAIGAFLQPGRFPQLEALFKEVDAEIKPAADAAKYHWNRPRPFVADPARFSDVADPESTPGYPSAHSTRGTAFALLLAEIFPEQRAAILEKGRLIGWTRVEIGSHTPQDIYAGRVLGQALAQAFLRDSAFQRDLASVKAEIAASR